MTRHAAGRLPSAILLLATAAQAAPPIEEMMRSTVQFRLSAYNADGRRLVSWGGSGYIIGDGRHVVTNYHVCCDPDIKPDEWPPHVPFAEAARTIEIAIEKDQWVPASVVWHSAAKDLGIVRLNVDSGRPPVTFAPRRFVSEGMHVWALGFPGAADTMTDEEGAKKVKVSDGVVSAVTRTRTDRRILAGAEVYQTNLSTNPGNSGGPVFDDCGRVIATHSHSTRADGVKWEVQADELIEELPALSITVKVAESGCAAETSGGRGNWDYVILAGQFATAVLALAAIVMVSTRRGRDYVKKVTTSYRHGGPGPAPAKGRPVLKGLSGFYSGTVLELGFETFTIGRDTRTANLVFPPDAGVSRRHCSVRFDAALHRFVLEDTWSTNGTFLENGEPVTPGKPYELKAGTRFYLGNRENTFEVNVEGAG